MTRGPLSADQLARRCDPAALEPEAGPAPAPRVVGQERATEALRFAFAIDRPGYHVFVAGPPGSGRRALARSLIDVRANSTPPHRPDWAYVNNFALPHRPVALELPPGRAVALRGDMRALVRDLRSMIRTLFESEDYANEIGRIELETKERVEKSFLAVGEEAQRRGLAVLHTPVGFTVAPQKDGEVMAPEVYEALPEAERLALQKSIGEVQEQLARTVRGSMRLRKDLADRVRELNRTMTRLACDHAFEEIRAKYADLPHVLHHLEAMRDDVIEHVDDFRAGDDDAERRDELARYEVNVLLDAGAGDGGPVVEADLPSVHNLVGRVDHLAQFGMLTTDFRLIKGGLLHRANGGYLIVDAVKLLTQPLAWPTLKRALQRGEIRIESVSDWLGAGISTVRLEPEPIPLRVKVVLIGSREVCALLQEHDEEFAPLFGVVADLEDDLPRTPGTTRSLARALTERLHERGLLPPSAAALARTIDHGVRLAADTTRISAQVRRLLDVLQEADHRARAGGRSAIEAADVEAAIAARRQRAARADERRREAVVRDILLIATAGERVGQVNGLSVHEVGGELFGTPVRITATTRLGQGDTIDVQRETQLGGPLHSKGVLILGAFLAARYSRPRPYPIVGSLVFEQAYGLVEGDSASLAELLALLSSIGDVPLRQGMAVTGSVNQFGDVQAVGGVNEKIEGFFDICAARGLDGRQGVVIPASNVEHLMLRADLVAAVAAGRFGVHAVATVDDALELLTGLPAGDPVRPDPATVNGRIALRLRELARPPRTAVRHRPGAGPQPGTNRGASP